jgi:hypothetical protein
MNKGTLVYTDNISVGDVADEIPAMDDKYDELESGSDYENENGQETIKDKPVSPEDMYFTAMEIKNIWRKALV